jgi:hypothetical protein
MNKPLYDLTQFRIMNLFYISGICNFFEKLSPQITPRDGKADNLRLFKFESLSITACDCQKFPSEKGKQM